MTLLFSVVFNVKDVESLPPNNGLSTIFENEALIYRVLFWTIFTWPRKFYSIISESKSICGLGEFLSRRVLLG